MIERSRNVVLYTKTVTSYFITLTQRKHTLTQRKDTFTLTQRQHTLTQRKHTFTLTQRKHTFTLHIYLTKIIWKYQLTIEYTSRSSSLNEKHIWFCNWWLTGSDSMVTQLLDPVRSLI